MTASTADALYSVLHSFDAKFMFLVLMDTGQEPSLSMRSEDTKSPKALQDASEAYLVGLLWNCDELDFFIRFSWHTISVCN